ncbi:MAG TPA: CBS domain-containing protein [Casimicrobiaceae bacterium]|nr:CBS domain-containing protein [Casimicrobiaceae bacterium]
MLDEPVRKAMRRGKVLKAAPQTSVFKAAGLMAAKDVGAILVVEDGQLIGIFTERDMLVRVVARGLDARATRLSDVMTRAPHTIDADKPFGYALLVMHQKGFRHLPVINDGKLIGIVSSRSAMDPELEEFAFEATRREHFSAMR